MIDLLKRLVKPKKPAAKIREAILETPQGPVTVRAKRSRRARRMTLRIDAANDCAVLVLPTYVALAEGLDFARSKADWLQAKLAALPARQNFSDGAALDVMGRRIVIRRDPARGARIAEENGILYVGGEEALLRGRVLRWLKAEVKREIGRIAALRAAELGLRHGRISLRDSRSRWGSCSSDGNLSFCWRLVFAPPDVLDYVVSHEVAHLAEMNHGPQFWQTVERLTPHTETARGWLAAHATTLQRLG